MSLGDKNNRIGYKNQFPVKIAGNWFILYLKYVAKSDDEVALPPSLFKSYNHILFIHSVILSCKHRDNQTAASGSHQNQPQESIRIITSLRRVRITRTICVI